MLYYLNSFLIYSMVGFLLETILKTFFFPHMNNGILYGPWIPVYGLGVVVIVFITRYVFHRIKVPKWLKVIIIFITVMVILTILEFLGGILIEKLFHKVFWDYSKMKFNFGHYISLEMSLLWASLSIAFIYLIKPWMDKLVKKIPSGVSYFVFSLFIVDVIFTFLSV